MQKDGARAPQLISIDEVHGPESNTTNADIMKVMNNPQAGRSGSAALVALSDRAPASYPWG